MCSNVQEEEKMGKRYALYLLSKRAYLCSDLMEKLEAKGISSETAKGIIRFCLEKGFLDDSSHIARLVAKELRKAQSVKAVFFKLRAKKGIDENLLKSHLEQLAPSNGDALQKWLIKNQRRINFNDRDEVRKTVAKLCRKGFSVNEVVNAIKNLS
jgi:SOS response regulatory protein OraA/RecX